jgi:hypothetical protein
VVLGEHRFHNGYRALQPIESAGALPPEGLIAEACVGLDE